MGCTPSTQQYDDDYSVDSSSDEDTAGSTARSPRSSQRDVRHWRKVDDHQVAIGEAPQLATPPSPAIKLAPAVNGAKKPKSPAHAARRASGIEREASLDDSALRRPPMIRVDSLTSVRTDGPSP